MAVRPVLRLGDPRLRVRSTELETADFGSARLVALVEDLRDTMAAAAGAGLAAPQIGVPLRVVQHECDPIAFGFIPELQAAGLIPAVPG